jgi:hypothetical protein
MHDTAYGQLTVIHDPLPSEPPRAGTLQQLIQGELEGGEGSPEWRGWVARVAARLGLTSAA